MSGLKLLIDSAHGVYVPQSFIECYDPTAWGVDPGDVETLMEGPEAEWYWEAWNDVTSKAEFTDPEGNTWKLYQDGDLWAFCDALMDDEEYENFFGEPRE